MSSQQESSFRLAENSSKLEVEMDAIPEEVTETLNLYKVKTAQDLKAAIINLLEQETLEAEEAQNLLWFFNQILNDLSNGFSHKNRIIEEMKASGKELQQGSPENTIKMPETDLTPISTGEERILANLKLSDITEVICALYDNKDKFKDYETWEEDLEEIAESYVRSAYAFLGHEPSEFGLVQVTEYDVEFLRFLNRMITQAEQNSNMKNLPLLQLSSFENSATKMIYEGFLGLPQLNAAIWEDSTLENDEMFNWIRAEMQAQSSIDNFNSSKKFLTLLIDSIMNKSELTLTGIGRTIDFSREDIDYTKLLNLVYVLNMEELKKIDHTKRQSIISSFVFLAASAMYSTYILNHPSETKVLIGVSTLIAYFTLYSMMILFSIKDSNEEKQEFNLHLDQLRARIDEIISENSATDEEVLETATGNLEVIEENGTQDNPDSIVEELKESDVSVGQ